MPRESRRAVGVMSSATLNGHRAHDCVLLTKRWAGLAVRSGLRWTRIATAGDHPVCCAESPAPKGDTRPTIYLSAGVHGDEAAAPWGLLEWGEANIPLLRAHRFLIFPCLNPQGIRDNTRVDHRGIDINRTFHDAREPLIAAWRRVIGERAFSLALCLHEDYDAQGCYIYELTHRPGVLGDCILRDCGRIIPRDLRRRIDGRVARNGLIIRRVPPVLRGLPEAIVLHQIGAPITLTFESPSEYSLTDRVAVQKEFIRSALAHALGI